MLPGTWEAIGGSPAEPHDRADPLLPDTQRSLAPSQGIFFGSIVLVCDGGEALQVEPGEGGRRVHALTDGQKRRSQAVLQLRMQTRAEHHGLDRERFPGFDHPQPFPEFQGGPEPNAQDVRVYDRRVHLAADNHLHEV